MIYSFEIMHSEKNYKFYFNGSTVFAPIISKNEDLNCFDLEEIKGFLEDKSFFALAFFASNPYLHEDAHFALKDWIKYSSKEDLDQAELLAKILINSKWEGGATNKAQLFLNILNGNLPDWMKEKEKTLLEKDNDKFLRKKSKLKLEYMLEHGKKCEFCNKTFEPIKLCLVKKDKQKIGYSFDRVLLICKSCNSKR
jgi:hypothetical protein